MSNDNNTLADVQPGGMVRLATVPYDRARDLMGDAYNAGTHGIGYSQQAMELHDAIIPAQPSPGGQGGLNYERMFVDACAALAEVSRELGCDPEQGGAEPILAAIAELREALAARQPVGEPPMEMRICELRHVSLKPNRPYIFTVDANCANCRADAAYAMGRTDTPPAHAVDHQAALLAEERAHGETIDQRDRCEEVADELAARISSITGVDIGEHTSANCPWQNAIEAADEYKPAHAVDLDELRRAVCLVNVVGQIDGHDVVRRNSVLDVIANRRQRLIDSQAVGNG